MPKPMPTEARLAQLQAAYLKEAMAARSPATTPEEWDFVAARARAAARLLRSCIKLRSTPPQSTLDSV